MTDYEYILAQCRKTDAASWSEEMVEDCKTHFGTLSDNELVDLLLEKDVQLLGTICPFYPDENDKAIMINEFQDKLKTAIMKAVSTIKLVELMYSSPNDFIGKKGRERSIDFLEAFGRAYNLIREELRKRYLDGIDAKIIENVFNHTNETNKEWLKWQKRKQKAVKIRYQDPYYKSLENHEFYFTKEDLEHGVIGFDHVISIKGCNRFWIEDRMRLAVVDYILWKLCGIAPQYIGIGEEVVFAVTPYDYDLHEDFDNTPLHKKLYEVIDKEYQRNLVLGCLLIERFVHLVNPKTHAKVRYYDREYLAGRFVMGEWNTNKLFGDNPFHSYIEKMAPEEKKKFDSFLELADILLNPEPKVPF